MRTCDCRVLEEAVYLGINDYLAYGGEPLLREDFADILRMAREKGMRTYFPTNGTLLEERAHELAPYIDVCEVSIDAIGEKHDRLRGKAGVFDQAIKGLEALKRAGTPGKLRFCTQLHRENVSEVEKVVMLAQELKVEVEIMPTWRIEGYNESFVLSLEEKEHILTRLQEMKKKGYPIVNMISSLEIIKTNKPFKCNLPRLVLSSDWDGSIVPCVPKVSETLH